MHIPTTLDSNVKAMHLKPLRTAKYRPNRELLIDVIKTERPIDVVFRNGSRIRCTLAKFNKYEMLFQVMVDGDKVQFIGFMHGIYELRYSDTQKTIAQAPKQRKQPHKAIDVKETPNVEAAPIIEVAKPQIKQVIEPPKAPKKQASDLAAFQSTPPVKPSTGKTLQASVVPSLRKPVSDLASP